MADLMIPALCADMQSRIIEIADNNRHLSLYRGFLIVKNKSEKAHELGRIALDDIIAVIANAHGISYTNSLLVALAQRGIVLVLCGDNHKPAGLVWPVDGHHLQAARFDAQIAAKSPCKKRLWQSIVRCKIAQQAAVLDRVGAKSTPLTALITKVKSGDSSNIEAQAAQRYWKLLFSDDFRRNRSAEDQNALLNYGYTVQRAATARAVIAAGLHPSIGLHHSNQSNAMRLVDDLMEPFRPLIDLTVYQLWQAGSVSLNTETKRTLALTLYLDMQTDEGRTPVFLVMQRLATSLAQVFMGERQVLQLPEPQRKGSPQAKEAKNALGVSIDVDVSDV